MSGGKRPIYDTDIFIVGSGPAGCTYARLLLDNTNEKITMAEMGKQHSQIPGENLKNSPYFQKNPDAFTHLIQAHLHNLSPGNADLPGASVTYAVGGMATHWTCATPRPHEDELPDSYEPSEWDRLFTKAEKLIQTNFSPFEDCIGQQIVAHALEKKFGHKRQVKSLPLAVIRQKETYPFVTWSGCDTILGHQIANSRFTLKASTHVQKLLHDGHDVTHAQCYDLSSGEIYFVNAKVFIVCCGTFLSPQLLHASGIGGDNVGRYLTDHPVCFTQVVLADEHLDWARNNPLFSAELQKNLDRNPRDEIPIPSDEPDPQLYTPYTRETPWHTQIHREAFQYGEINKTVDQRLVIHLRWYARQDPQRDNRVQFLDEKDIWGMPKPNFICSLSERDKERNKMVFDDMIQFANTLGPYLPGAEPHWRPYGQALHAAGTTRVGHDPETSVLDPTLRLHGYHNIYVGGNSTIPTAASVNPTLTNMAYIVKSVEDIVRAHGF